MELPVSSRSYQPTPEAQVRSIHQAGQALAQTTATLTTIHGVSAYTHPDRPGVRAVNFVAQATTHEADVTDAQLVQAVKDHYQSCDTPCHMWQPTGSDWPASLADALVEAGYQPTVRRVFTLMGYQRPASFNEAVQVVPARSIYPRLDAFYQRMAKLEHHADDALAAHFAQTMIDFLDEPRLEVLIARVDGHEVAAAGVLSLGQVGVIVPAWSDPSQRGKGVAKALMVHLLDYCARAVFQQVLLDRAQGCPAISFYESLGFTSQTQFTRYRLKPSHDPGHADHE